MKKIILFFVFGILFQSCFSYKTVENNSSQYKIGKIYKLKQGKKSEKVKIISKTDSTLVFNHKFEEKEISLNSISKAEKRKFSIVKTVFFPPLTIAVLIGVLASSVKINTGGILSPP